MFTHDLGKRLRAIVLTGLVAGSVFSQAVDAPAQTYDTQFSEGTVEGAACPPSMPAYYNHPRLAKTFWGRSEFTMAQWDEYHTYQVYSYKFSGETSDGLFKITGIHHVASAQWLWAAYSYWTGVPAGIFRLHAERLISPRTSNGGDCGYQFVHTTTMDGEECDPNSGSSGSGPGEGGGGGGTDLCVFLNLDSGCYDVYVDDVYDGTVCC